MKDIELLKKKALEAAETFEFIFEDTEITKVEISENEVLFYEGDDVKFRFSADQIINNDY